MDTKQIIKEYYNANASVEWNRIADRPEFVLTCRYLDRYIKPGDRVLDIGGGPGRYSLHLAANSVKVTLFDLADENLKFAQAQAVEQGIHIETVCGDACIADELVNGTFDHVLLMGPMYHLLNETDRIKAVNASLSLLKPGGVIFVSFINMIAGMIFAMKIAPQIITSDLPSEVEYRSNLLAGKSYGGDAFTQAYFIDQHEVLPFMAQFPLEKLHLFGQESITSPCEGNIMSQPKEIVDAWMYFVEQLCEREELLSWSEHLMYVGRKI